MNHSVDKKIKRIASKLNIRDPKKKIETAQQINQLAIMLIDMRKKI